MRRLGIMLLLMVAGVGAMRGEAALSGAHAVQGAGLVQDANFAADNTPDDAAVYGIEAITVSVPIKHGGDYREQPVAATTLAGSDIENNLIVESKNLSLTIPNMLHADYGARMTASIYVRGLGSRIDQPAVGLYVDNVPVLNKNNYDFDYFDVQRIDVLRGPQGTLYGRNTIGGVIDIRTLSPFDYQGTRVGVGYGNGNTWHVDAAVYRKPSERLAFSVAASHQHTDGFFENAFDGSEADRASSGFLRMKVQAILSERWSADNSLYLNTVKQNGFAYAQYLDGRQLAIDHNDPCGYDRFGLIDGLTFNYRGEYFRFSSTTSYQYTRDEMVLDQDFTSRPIFTLRQTQREHGATQEFVLRSLDGKRWQWLTGVFGFYRGLRAEAPVTFKREGIEELILKNANAGIHNAFPDADIMIREEQFPVNSSFRLPAYGISAFHQSSWRTGRWVLTAGIRADYEHTAIRYENDAEIHYRFSLTMPEYRALPVALDGDLGKAYFEVTPRVAALYETGFGNLYAVVARGYKAGGYNTQMFSDVMKNRMMDAMTDDLGVYLPGQTPYGIDRAISYKPERSRNYEIGGHFSLIDGRLLLDAAIFYIDCRNQQLTVFPPGESIGRMMSNAGRTRSYGAELTASYRAGDFRFTGSYGNTNARFTAYFDGVNDYAGKYVPYAPRNTLSVRGEWALDLGADKRQRLLFGIGMQGAGRIYWNEDNSRSQPFYCLLNGSVAWQRERFTLSVWARNMTGTSYNTFYFKSMENEFFQLGKPAQAGITLNLNL